MRIEYIYKWVQISRAFYVNGLLDIYEAALEQILFTIESCFHLGMPISKKNTFLTNFKE